jgi:hypothetical protein
VMRLLGVKMHALAARAHLPAHGGRPPVPISLIIDDQPRIPLGALPPRVPLDRLPRRADDLILGEVEDDVECGKSP